MTIFTAPRVTKSILYEYNQDGQKKNYVGITDPRGSTDVRVEVIEENGGLMITYHKADGTKAVGYCIPHGDTGSTGEIHEDGSFSSGPIPSFS